MELSVQIDLSSLGAFRDRVFFAGRNSGQTTQTSQTAEYNSLRDPCAKARHSRLKNDPR